MELSTADILQSHSQNTDRTVGRRCSISSAPTCTLSQRINPPLGLFCSMKGVTPDECQRRADEAKALAIQTQDLWKRELLLKIADQWQLIAAHRAAKRPQALKLVRVRPLPRVGQHSSRPPCYNVMHSPSEKCETNIDRPRLHANLDRMLLGPMAGDRLHPDQSRRASRT